MCVCVCGRLIESSLTSVATKLNFFLHNLAQMKFASSDERPSLSFAPRVHVRSAGVIRNLHVCRHIRTATSSKGHVSPHTQLSTPSTQLYPAPAAQGALCLQVFVVKVQKDGHKEALFVQRTFEEFHELHSKLRLLFPASKLPT